MEKHHLLLERRRMMVKFQILWRILMRLPRLRQTELSQLLKIKLEETCPSVAMALRKIESKNVQVRFQAYTSIPLFTASHRTRPRVGVGGYDKVTFLRVWPRVRQRMAPDAVYHAVDEISQVINCSEAEPGFELKLSHPAPRYPQLQEPGEVTAHRRALNVSYYESLQVHGGHTAEWGSFFTAVVAQAGQECSLRMGEVFGGNTACSGRSRTLL
ncbi:hypothetical protein AAY473_015782 [Plecturocebus cupreus]